MKSMKKMLCLLLVAMLLVAAMPVAASADSNTPLSIYYSCPTPGAGANRWIELDTALATTILYNKDEITALRASEAFAINNSDIIAKLGINTNLAYIKSVTRTAVNENQVNYTVELSAVDKPATTNQYVQARIYDGDTDTGKTMDVYCQVITHTAPASTEVSKILTAPTAAEVKSALGTAYTDKTITSITTRIIVGGGSTVPAVYVTTGTAPSNTTGGSTVITTPVGDGTVVVTPPESNNGGSGSNNGVTTYNVKFYDVNGSCHWNINVASGSTVGIADNSTATQISYAEEHVGTKSGYTFSGWKKNGTGDVLSTATVADLAITANTEFRPVFTANSSSSGSGSSGTTNNKFPYPVYLNIYKDTLVGSPDKRVEITKGIALDGLVSLEEAKTVVKNYYTAKDSDGISYDGLYIAEGNWVANYVADTQKYDSIDAGSMRQTGTVYINVMIGNAKAKTSATADASNPKTGDTIFVPFMVMGVTATALAAAYVFGKKRIAR